MLEDLQLAPGDPVLERLGNARAADEVARSEGRMRGAVAVAKQAPCRVDSVDAGMRMCRIRSAIAYISETKIAVVAKIAIGFDLPRRPDWYRCCQAPRDGGSFLTA